MPTVDEELERIRRLLVDAHERGVASGLGSGVLTDDDEVEGHNNPGAGGAGEIEKDDDGMLFVESFRNVTSVPRGFTRGRKRPRPLSLVNTVLIHQTAVAGGFGLSERLLGRHTGQVFSARQERYRDTPYHGMYSPMDRGSVVQWPAWVHTFHGNGGNDYSVGWAYDGKLPGDVLDLHGARSALRHFVTAMREVGVELRYVEAHRQHSNQRGGDPGADIWSSVVRPLLDELRLEERPTRTTGTGLPLPNDWRGHSS
ncbi:hypothetical protein DB30_05516 [Enhygromyxa salina]|uniref:N-acetylmuramoyl-L-alanine amidase n=1 Tax=Enhygromyxa salina TaxID=215803 RepID=A0A0C1ZWR3_9BACT|nr:hypothetical protein [Enhygromyxa salina]KIG15493.1 hypothetical protein DB30_05516 [Enhygromyxa salina]